MDAIAGCVVVSATAFELGPDDIILSTLVFFQGSMKAYKAEDKDAEGAEAMEDKAHAKLLDVSDAVKRVP